MWKGAKDELGGISGAESAPGGAKAGVSVLAPMMARRYAHSPPVLPPGLCHCRIIINGLSSTCSFSSFGSSSGPAPLLLWPARFHSLLPSLLASGLSASLVSGPPPVLGDTEQKSPRRGALNEQENQTERHGHLGGTQVLPLVTILEPTTIHIIIQVHTICYIYLDH